MNAHWPVPAGLHTASLQLPVEGVLPSFDGATGWLNSPSLTPADLRGKVVLVDFWTYTCINWLRQLPYVRAWAEKYADQGLVVIGVHTPEFPFEKDADNVRQAVQDMRVTYPFATDNNYAVWLAFDNHYWPALYFADAQGRIRHHHFGEGEYQQSEMVIQQLLAEAGATDISRELVSVDARGIEAAADWASLRSELGAVVDYVVCPSCGRAEADDGRTTRCRDCGADLYVPCPRCRVPVPALAGRCRACGLDLLAHRREQVAARWRSVADAVATRRLQAAHEALVALAHDDPDGPGPDGRPASAWLAEVGPVLEQADRDVAAAASRPLAEREAALAGVLDRVADHRRATAELVELPPAPPGPVHAGIDDGEVLVRWAPSPSRGAVTYRVTRTTRQGQRPPREQTVGSTGGRELGDGGVPSGASAEYAVVALRGGRQSEPSRSAAVVVVGEVDAVVATAREGEVEVRWRWTGDPDDVWVERTRIDGPSEPTRRFRPGGATLVDRDLAAGARYRYRVFAEVPDGAGGTTRTEGSASEATAVVAPDPVTDLVAQARGAAVELRWTPPRHGEVVVVRSPADTGIAERARVTPEQLSRLGTTLPRGVASTVDTGPPGLRHYVPVSIDGDVGVAGRSVLHLGVGDVDRLHAVDWGSAVVLTWVWPPGVTEALVVWRRDRFATGPDDPAADRRKVTNVVYERDGGVALGGEGEQPFHVSVHSGAGIGAARAWAPAPPQARVRVRGPRTEFVHYDVKRSGLRGRGVRLDLDSPVPLPELVLVGAPGEQPPTYPVHGRELVRVPAGATRVRQEVDVAAAPSPLAVRLFVVDPAGHPDVVLRDPTPDRLVVR